MSNITAADVNKLRKSTGAGIMDCKKALVEANGDFDLAIENLRKKGQKVAAKRADRESREGAVIAKVNSDSKSGVIISLNCETDFVAKNEDFIVFVLHFHRVGYGIRKGISNQFEVSFCSDLLRTKSRCSFPADW